MSQAAPGAAVSEQEFRRALGYANSAMDLLKRGRSRPTRNSMSCSTPTRPGVNPSLNQRINQIFRDGTPTHGTGRAALQRIPQGAGRQRAHLAASPSAWRRASRRCTTPSTRRWRPPTPIPARCRRRAATSAATWTSRACAPWRSGCSAKPAACRTPTASSSRSSRPRATTSPRCSATSTKCAASRCSTR